MIKWTAEKLGKSFSTGNDISILGVILLDKKEDTHLNNISGYQVAISEYMHYCSCVQRHFQCKKLNSLAWLWLHLKMCERTCLPMLLKYICGISVNFYSTVSGKSNYLQFVFKSKQLKYCLVNLYEKYLKMINAVSPS